MGDDATPAVAAFLALAGALDLTVEPEAPDAPPGRPRIYLAEGEVGGRSVQLGGMLPSRTDIPVRIATQPSARDLRVQIFARRPRRVFQQDARRAGDLWLRGRGDHRRALTLVDGPAGAHLRELAHLDAVIDDSHVGGHVDIVAGAEAAGDVRHLVALAAAADTAAARVAVDPEIAWAAPRFAIAADRLGLAFTTCPFGLRGTLDGCRIVTHTLWTDPRTLFFHVHYQRVMPGRWAVRTQGRRWYQRLRAAVQVLAGGGLGSGQFAFDRRFYLEGDRTDAVRAVAPHLAPLIDFADAHWLSILGDRLLVAVRLRRDRPPDLPALLTRAVAVAHRLGGTVERAPAAGPFR